MTVSAEVLADSIHPITRSRLTTMRIRTPRMIWSEFMTHRLFARCAASSRAIPSSRMRTNIRADMAMPLVWGENRPGMQAGAPISRGREFLGRFLWRALGHLALFVSALLDRLGVHKQIVNRVTEPWSHITAIVTGTDAAFANFYALRRHPAAEPTIHALADAMAAAHRASHPRELRGGQWHLPFVSDAEHAGLLTDTDALVHSVARVARVSYDKPDGKIASFEEDRALCKRLLESVPMHASPAEHQACATDYPPSARGLAGCFGDSSGWIQYRKTLQGECSTTPLVIAFTEEKKP